MPSARLWIVAAALLFSTGGAAIKATSLGPAAVAAGRSLVAFAVLLAVTRGRGLRPRPLDLVTAGLYAATLVLYVFANRTTTAAAAVFLQGTAPLYLLFLAPLFLRERPGRRDLGLFLLMVVGLLGFFLAPGASQATAPRPLLGNALSAASGLTWAGTVLGLRWLARDGSSPLPAVVTGNALVVLVLLPFLEVPGSLDHSDVLVLLWLGVFQIAVAYLLAARGMARVPAFQASLLFLLEPAFGPLWAWLFLRERPAALELAGGALILVAGLLAASRREPHST